MAQAAVPTIPIYGLQHITTPNVASVCISGRQRIPEASITRLIVEKPMQLLSVASKNNSLSEKKPDSYFVGKIYTNLKIDVSYFA